MTDAKLLRFAAVLVVLAGYVFVFRAGEARIGDRLAENAITADRLRADERTLASRNTLDAERLHLRAQLRPAEANVDRSVLTAHFLRDAAASAAARHTTFTTIAASGMPPVNAPSAPTTVQNTPVTAQSSSHTGQSWSAAVQAVTFDELPLEVTLEGRYADVLATVRALSAGPVPATVDVTALARKNAAGPDDTLVAAVRVVLERIVPAAAAETTGA